jgi:lysophospholipase L1-like esterase
MWITLALAVPGPACGEQDAGFLLRDGGTVVFLGDSITYQRLYTTYIEAYALTRFPKQAFTFRNVGVGGDTAWFRRRVASDENLLFAASDTEQQKMVEKAVGAGLARDVLPLKPTVVTVDFGMNDHGFGAFREDFFRAYCRSQKEIVRALTKSRVRVVLLTPQPIEESGPRPDQDLRNQALRKFSDGLKAICSTDGAVFVDQFDPYMALILREHAADPNAFIGGDNGNGGNSVHPGPAGHTLMAWAILRGLHAPALVSTMELDVSQPERAKVVRAENCRVSNLKYDNGTLSFDRLDDALPMPVDPRAEPALKLAPVLDDLNRYEMKVTGLAAGRYNLTVDGDPAGSVTASELEKGCNLAIAPGPITRQAQLVLSLVFKKNEVFFDRWFNVQLAGGPESRLAELDQQISGLEAAINAARIPKPHHFELKP